MRILSEMKYDIIYNGNQLEVATNYLGELQKY
jgi:hypothetical protein